MDNLGAGEVGATEAGQPSRCATKRRRRSGREATEAPPAEPEASAVRAVERESKTHVLLSSIDFPHAPLEVSRQLLDDHECRLTALVRHQAPEQGAAGPYWRTGMRKDMLLTIVQSWTLGRIVLSPGVELEEALQWFAYESIAVSGGGSARKRGLLPPMGGLSSRRRDVKASVRLASLCDQLAVGILAWPRLAARLDDALHGRVGSSAGPADQKCSTSTCAWIRLCDVAPPAREEAPTDALYKRRHVAHAAKTLISIGMVHARSTAENYSSIPREHDQAAFQRLAKEVEADPLGPFFPMRYDFVKSLADKAERLELSRGERFAQWVSNCVTAPTLGDKGEDCASAAASAPLLRFARAVLSLAQSIQNDMPSLGTLFSGVCCNSHESTPERAALKKALKAHGVAVIRWDGNPCPSGAPLTLPIGFGGHPDCASRCNRSTNPDSRSRFCETHVLLNFEAWR